MNSARAPLALYLALGYALLVVYASLYPLSGWHDSGGDPLGFVFAGWPRYTTSFDLITNLAAYLPLGFLLAAAGRRYMVTLLAVVMAVLAAGLLSFVMEFLQNYLPSRVASNLDWGGNVLGAVLGAWPGARFGPRLIDDLRHSHWPGQGGRTDAGLMLLGLWLLTQFDPTTLLFGAGDLRRLLDLPAADGFRAESFQRVETAIAAAASLAMLLIAQRLAPSGRHDAADDTTSLHAAGRGRTGAGFALTLLATGLLARTLALALMMQPQAALTWATPGTLQGLFLGVTFWLLAALLSPAGQRALAALALLLATVMVNLAPENPYLENTLSTWNPGQFLNFHGATRLTASLWPWLALPWLVWQKRNVE